MIEYYGNNDFRDYVINDYLAHLGILGMKWGQRNGPPYPLGAGDHSKSEQRAGWRKSLGRGSGSTPTKKKLRKKRVELSDAQKRYGKAEDRNNPRDPNYSKKMAKAEARFKRESAAEKKKLKNPSDRVQEKKRVELSDAQKRYGEAEDRNNPRDPNYSKKMAKAEAQYKKDSSKEKGKKFVNALIGPNKSLAQRGYEKLGEKIGSEIGKKKKKKED